MARSRNIKPGFFKNELLAEMPPETRLLFMGLWCLADREGRFEDRPKKIKMELFPCDSFSIEDSLALLAADGFLVRYEVNGKRYAQVVNFTKHQMPHHKEMPSEIPAPPGFEQVTKHAYDVSKQTRDEVFARDGSSCLKCGSTDDLSLDHIKPLSSGGDNATSNLQTLCKSCNSAKGNTTKDHRKSNVEPTLNQAQPNVGARCPSDSLIPDSLIPDSSLLIPDCLKGSGDTQAQAPASAPAMSGGVGGDENPAAVLPDPPEPLVPPDDPAPVTIPSMAGAVCMAMRANGMQSVNPSHPELQVLLDKGADIGLFASVASECVERGKGFGYALATVRGRMADAAKTAASALAAPSNSKPAMLSFSEREKLQKMRDYKEMTGRDWPTDEPASRPSAFANVIDITPIRSIA